MVRVGRPLGVVLATVVSAIALASCGQPASTAPGPSVDPASPLAAQAPSAAAEAGGTAEIATVALRTGSSSATIRGVDDVGYTVRRTVHFADAGVAGPEPAESSHLDGTSLVLEGCPLPDCYFAYEVSVPRTAAVTGETGSGAVDVGGIGGPVRIVAGSGAVRLADVSGEVQVQTGSGGVSGDRLGGPRTEITTGSGAVDLRTATVQSVRAESSTGSLRIVVAPGRYRVDVRSDATTQVEVPDDTGASATIDARSHTGNVAVGLG